MIVEIEIPVMMEHFDFDVDEQAAIGAVINEIIDVICRNNRCSVLGDPASVMIWRKDTRQQLQKNRTLADYGIGSGAKLILV